MDIATTPFKRDALKGKVALVTGGGSGINFGIAEGLGLHGCKIAVVGRRKEVIDEACKKLGRGGIEAVGFSGDVRKYEDCQKVLASTISTFGRLDILVNGAAGNFLCPPEELSANGFKTVMDIDAGGTFNMSRAAFSALKESKGLVLNVSATLHYGATPLQTHASAAKAAVDSITRSLAQAWGKFGIRVNGIAPGYTEDTEGASRLSGGADSEQLKEMVAYIPLRRFGKKSDIAWSAVFLASSAASYISGLVMVVDGAAWLWKKPFVSDEVYQFIASQRKSKL